MDNGKISDTFSLLSKLTDIHGENSFKAKSYSSAAFSIDKLSVQLKDLPPEKISSLPGIGTSSAQKIIELLQNGKIISLEEIIFRTPPGILEMLTIKGIGPKKIHTIWKEMEIETIGELLYACKENRLKLYKGFGEKTQQQITETIEYYLKNKGTHLYATVTSIAKEVESFLFEIFKNIRVELTGNFLRQFETIDALEFMVETSIQMIEETINKYPHFILKDQNEAFIRYATSLGIDVLFYAIPSDKWVSKSLQYSSSANFYSALEKNLPHLNTAQNEADFFEKNEMMFIPPFLRETPEVILLAQQRKLPAIIQQNDIKGIIHCHSNWSDGSNTIEEMALACRERGLSYLVMSDHSKSAFYAQGLSEEKIRAQHKEIDALNKKLAPFKIFKSIESDILNDGSLDYSTEVLASFDLVIASIHSNLKMTEEKAMARLIKAIEHPYTTILGHLTGRLLLSRPGYPINHRKIIDACAANKVAIELNANPNRLDIDWRYIHYALEKDVLISINPDAHHIDGLDDIKYGVWVAQKAMLTKEQNLSSFSLEAFETYLKIKKANL